MKRSRPLAQTLGDHDTSANAVSRHSRSPFLMTGVVAGAFAAGVLVGGIPGWAHASAQSTLTDNPTFATLEQTWELIHEQWPEPENLDDAALIYGAAKGMVDAIGDTGHSAFLDPKMAIDYAQAREGQFVGIGVEVDARCGVPVVSRTMPGSPALEAGVKAGDVIAEVDGVSTHRISIDQLRQMILGKEDDSLELTIDREGEPQPLKIAVNRRMIDVDPVTWTTLPDQTVQLRIAAFEPGVAREVRDSLAEIRAAGTKRLILDLRGNPGGLVPEVIGVASQFLDEGKTVFIEETRDQPPHALKTVGQDGEWQDLALIVLIDEGSASGAEVLAAALHDNGRAELIGERTFGTGTVLATFPQDDGSSVVLGNAFWLTPKGEHIWKQGVDPDEVVSLDRNVFASRPEDDPSITTAELSASSDTQLQEAFKVVTGEDKAE
ncbi:MAG: S41 family peptidase [Thermomicrobiales bacterium]